MRKLLKIFFIISLLSISTSAFGARTENEEFTFNNNVTFNSNVFLKGNAKITFPDGSVMSNATASTVDSYEAFCNNIQYPVFLIPMSGYSEGWTDFELKATTNNFDELKWPTNMVYMFESLGLPSGMTNIPVIDMNAKLYFCNVDPNHNARIFVTYTNIMSLTDQLGTNGNYVDYVLLIPSKTTLEGGTNFWMYPNNDKLIWTYHRRTPLTEETNNVGRTIWHPIVPTEWRKNIIVP